MSFTECLRDSQVILSAALRPQMDFCFCLSHTPTIFYLMNYCISLLLLNYLKGISAEFQVIRGFSQKIPADLLSYDKIHS